jgi:DNA-binding NtrC family response regulator
MSDLLLIDDDPGQLVAQVVGDAVEIGRQLHEPSPGTEPATAAEASGQLVGTCPAMRQVYKEIGLVAVQDIPVIITGESGTGKELVARAIHEHSGRAGRPFLALNAAAISEALLESELFGHEKGAFTGAPGKRVGKFEQCHGGTLFLDELGDMRLAIQAKLLRVLQEQAAFLPESLGGSSEPAPAITPRQTPGLKSFISGRLGPDACDLYAETHRQVDRLLLPRVLDYTRGSQHKAASLLGIARQTLRLKLREQGLHTNCPVWNRR